ncbi:hypothetical protein C8Q76DRAFT_861225 [Earliella scabrosa]|nr:hypothetical protein C8Q76DRAFT_861225 [Earliella scabrosa]
MTRGVVSSPHPPLLSIAPSPSFSTSSEAASMEPGQGPRFFFELAHIDESVPKTQEMQRYIGNKCACCYNLHELPEMGSFSLECAESVRRHTEEELLVLGNAEALLELGFRYMSGCGVREKSIHAALYMLKAAAGSPSATVRQRASAHAAAAIVSCAKLDYPTDARADIVKARQLLREFMGEDADESDFNKGRWMCDMLMHATMAVRLGLVSRVIITIANKARSRLPEGAKREHAFLLETADRAEREFGSRFLKQLTKIENNERAYVCAGPGCKVGGLRKKALMACGGSCPADVKPHYCSKECQKRDWPRHKIACKAKKKHDAQPINTQEQAVVTRTEQQDKPEEPLGGEWLPASDADVRGPGHFIDAEGPFGDRMRFFSRSMQPTEMRKARQELEKFRDAVESESGERQL